MGEKDFTSLKKAELINSISCYNMTKKSGFRTDGLMSEWTDGRADRPAYKVACSRMKRVNRINVAPG